MSEPLIERVRRAIEHIAAENEIEIERIVVYGSQTREDHHEGSDLDIVLVSPDWKEINYYARPERFDIEWPYDDLPSVDIAHTGGVRTTLTRRVRHYSNRRRDRRYARTVEA